MSGEEGATATNMASTASVGSAQMQQSSLPSSNKISCRSSGGKTNAGKNKTNYSALHKPIGQKPCLGEKR